MRGARANLFSDAPRKWGYTLQLKRLRPFALGCPAQVGIHLFTSQGFRVRQRMPRASGDTPEMRKQSEDVAVDAPRKWGYTVRTVDPGRAVVGCPAQVGIHPRGSRRVPIAVWMPRASGDTPFS